MPYIFLFYIIYNLLLGFGFWVYFFYYKEEKYHSLKELWLMILFPAVGYGYWKYFSNKKSINELSFPLKWFVWKNMIKINWGFLISLAVIFIIISSGVLELFSGGGMEWADDEGTFFAFGLGLLFDLGSALFGLIGLLCLAITFGVLFFIFVLIPILITKSIESNYYRGELLKKQQNE